MNYILMSLILILQILAKIKGNRGDSAPFSLEEIRSTLLKLPNRFGGIHVDVRKSASETLVTLR